MRNPFEKCETYPEVGDVLRKKYEYLREKRVKTFEMTDAWIADFSWRGERLVFKLRTDYTRLQTKSAYPTNFDIFEVLVGQCFGEVKRDSRIGRWQGGAFAEILIAGSGGGDGIKTYESVFYIPLTWLPRIALQHRRNLRNETRARQARDGKYPYTAEDLKALAHCEALTERVRTWRGERHAESLKKHPIVDLSKKGRK